MSLLGAELCVLLSSTEINRVQCPELLISVRFSKMKAFSDLKGEIKRNSFCCSGSLVGPESAGGGKKED